MKDAPNGENSGTDRKGVRETTTRERSPTSETQGQSDGADENLGREKKNGEGKGKRKGKIDLTFDSRPVFARLTD